MTTIFGALGLAIPFYLVSDGLEQFSENERTLAEDALVYAWHGCFDHPIDRALHRKVKIIEMETKECPHGELLGHADLRAYTFFGIPTGEISITCGEVHC